MWIAEHRIALLHNLLYRAAQPPDLVKVTITIHHPVFRSLTPKHYFIILIDTTDDAQTGTFEDILTDIQTYPPKFPVVFEQLPNLGMQEDDNELGWRQMPDGTSDLETTYTYVVPGHCQRIEYISDKYEDYAMPVNDIRDALIQHFPLM